MKYSIEEFVQREFNYAIVDEVDSILVDEARPAHHLRSAEESTDKYYRINKLIYQLRKEKDFMIDEKAKSAYLTEEGVARSKNSSRSRTCMIPSTSIFSTTSTGAQGARVFPAGRGLHRKRRKVIIVDEFTGRLMPDAASATGCTRP